MIVSDNHAVAPRAAHTNNPLIGLTVAAAVCLILAKAAMLTREYSNSFASGPCRHAVRGLLSWYGNPAGPASTTLILLRHQEARVGAGDHITTMTPGGLAILLNVRPSLQLQK